MYNFISLSYFTRIFIIFLVQVLFVQFGPSLLSFLCNVLPATMIRAQQICWQVEHYFILYMFKIQILYFLFIILESETSVGLVNNLTYVYPCLWQLNRIFTWWPTFIWKISILPKSEICTIFSNKVLGFHYVPLYSL